MKKSTLVPFIVFIVLAGGLFYVFTSFQINLFEGKLKKYDYFYEKEVTETHVYSFGDVVSGNASLNAKGWALMAGVIGGIPLLVAMLIRSRIKRRERRRTAAAINAKTNETSA